MPQSAVPSTGDLLVRTAADSGRGSLRQAILDANARPGPNAIRFDAARGPFAKPQTITLRSDLPELTGELTIDGYMKDRLWESSGVTLSAGGTRRVLSVAPGARVRLASLTISGGRAPQGAGILNHGTLVISGVTFTNNRADQEGGALANVGGTLTVVNSTFADNRAGDAGGGIANLGGSATITNATLSANAAPRGGGLFTDGPLLLRNTILANSTGPDCSAAGGMESGTTHNLIEANDGCGDPITTADPKLERLGLYNGPTPTLPLGGGNPAIHFGDNGSAVDEHGERLAWDQRGNGDPRLVAGITDIGAFEVQAFPNLMVNLLDDEDRRGCSGAGASDCSLRGAITLANAAGKPSVIDLDPRLFAMPRTLQFAAPLPPVTADVTLDARGTGSVPIEPGALRTDGAGRLTVVEASRR